ncbi:MAG: glycosyltransferase family 39 protein [Pirellulales bacterium]
MAPAPSNPSRICRLIDRMPPRWVLLVLLCAAVVVRGRFVLSQGEISDPDNYGTVALLIYQGRTFGIYPPRFGLIRPTATRPPLYPLLLSSAYLVHLDAEGAAGLLHVVLATLTVWAVWHLGRLWKLSPGVCLVAAALVTVDPILLAHSVELMTETLAAALAMVTLIAVTHFARENSILWALLAGLFGGMCILCRPEFLVWIVGVAIAFPCLAVGPRRALRVALYLAVAAATLAPWGVRNYRLLGWPVVTTTHGGFTLLLANNPDFYEHLRSAPWGSTWDGNRIYQQSLDHLWTTARRTPEGPAYVDELANDRWAYRQAFENIRAEPAMFAWSCVVRVGRLWNVLPHQTSADESASRRGMRWAVAIWYTFEFALAAAGAWFLCGKLFAAPWVWGTLLVLSITAVHACYWTDMRMRAPLVGVVALAAAYGLAVLACRKPPASAFGEGA